MAIRTACKPSPRWQAGIAFRAKQLLEFAVMLLGASLDLTLVAKSGTWLLLVIVAIVMASLGVSYGASRLLGLPSKLSILVACGNSICGNSAIAAVAPVIGASSEDIGAPISLTAILGILTVIGLPVLVTLLGLSATQYGILAGLTVYAVPQVLAATLPVGLVPTQMGTFVKLARVLMLGPIVVALSFLFRKANAAASTGKGYGNALTWVPWFVPAFLIFAGLRSAGLIPQAAARADRGHRPRVHHRLHGGARIERRSAAIGADRPARDRRGDAVARLPHRDQPRRHPFFLSEYGVAQTTAAHGNFLKNAQIVSAPSIS
jgi:uncharacterized integral membrane protein (TIGR00698 family)